MEYAISFSEQAANSIRKLDKPQRERIFAVLERIKIRPEDFVEKLVGDKGYKLRIGDYRLFLDIEQNKLLIFVVEVRHRKNAYKR
ncbi:MAG: type II toxin-antitoxin system RelE/ParE family toxin [Nanoarchaeota archaeon]